MTFAGGRTDDAACPLLETGMNPGEARETRQPRIREIVSGILLLGAGGGETTLHPSKVHEFLHAMKPHESILSGLRFTLTGDVCFSRDVDQAIRDLVDAGFLREGARAVIVPGSAARFWKYLEGFLSNSQIQAIHSVSLRFHDRMRRYSAGPGKRA